MPEKFLSARRLAIVPTLRCSLKCKLCSNHMTLFKNPYDVPLENILSDIDHIFELFDHIEWLQFVGGEIFLHKDMAAVYEYALRYRSKFDKVILMTNATIAPRDAEIAALKQYGEQCEVMISDYGEYSYKREEMVKLCKESDVPCILKGYHGNSQYYDGWFDNTSFKRFTGSEAELKEQRDKCPQAKMKNMHCLNGKLHRCSNSCFMTELGISKPAGRDFVDLNDDSMSLEGKRDIIRGFYSEPVESCRICSNWNAADAERFPAAEQMN